MSFANRQSGFNTIDPTSIPGLKLWIDSTYGYSGTVGGALDSIQDRSGQGNNLSNTSNTGTRPALVIQSYSINGMAMFKRGRGTALYLESGGDWLSLSGLDTATALTFPGAISVFHVTKHTNTNTTPSNGVNTPLNILGALGSMVTLYTSVGFSAGRPQWINWEGAYITYNATRTNLNDGALHTVAWVRSGTSLTCYVDGVLDSSQTTGAYNANYGFNGIGGQANADGFQGYLGEVMAWETALTPQQVALLHTRAVNTWT